jgi:type I restriction enzyme S subunit
VIAVCDGWQTVKLREVAAHKGLVGGPFGSNLGRRDYVPSGIPVVRGQNLASPPCISFDDCVYVSAGKVASDLAGNTVEPGDLVFTQRGTLGQVAIMPPQPERAVLSQSQMRLRVDDTRADPRFVYYAVTATEFLKQIADNAIVAGVPHINLRILGSLQVPLPPLDEQRRIARVLGALDDLIDANRAEAARLGQLVHYVGQEILASLDGCPTARLDEVATISKGYSYKSAELVPGGGWLVPTYELAIPYRGRLDTFSDQVRALRDGQDRALIDADRLEQVRNELLPLLLSGRVRVDEVAA